VEKFLHKRKGKKKKPEEEKRRVLLKKLLAQRGEGGETFPKINPFRKRRNGEIVYRKKNEKEKNDD